MVAHLLVHAKDLCRFTQDVLAIHSHRPHVVGGDGEFFSASLTTAIARLPSRYAPSRSASAPPLPGKYLFLLSSFLHTLGPSILVAVRAQGFSIASKVRLSHPASVRPSYAPELSLVLTRGLLLFLPLSATTVLQRFFCLYRWYRQPGAWAAQNKKNTSRSGVNPETVSGPTYYHRDKSSILRRTASRGQEMPGMFSVQQLHCSIKNRTKLRCEGFLPSLLF